MAMSQAEIALIFSVVDKATAPITAITRQIAKLTAGYLTFRTIYRSMTEAEDVAAQLERTLQGVGAKSLITSQQVSKLATEIQNVSKFSDEAAKTAAEQLVRFGVVTNKSLEPTLIVTAKLARQMGTDLPQAASLVSRALLAPAAAGRMLRQVGVQLSETQLKQIKHFTETGERAKAMAVVMEELQRVTKGNALSVDTFSEAVGQLGNKIGELLEGKEGGLKKATEAVKKFSDLLSDPRFKKAADTALSGIVSLFSAIATGVVFTTAKIVEFGDALIHLGTIGEDGGWRAKLFDALGAHEEANAMRASGKKQAGDVRAKAGIFIGGALQRMPDGADYFTKRRKEGEVAGEGEGAVAPLKETQRFDQDSSYWSRMQEAAEESTASWKELVTGIPRYFDDFKAQTEDAVGAATEGIAEVTEAVDVFSDEAFRGIQNNITTFLVDPFNDGLKGLAKGILETFRNVLAQIAAESITRSLFKGGTSGFLGKVGGFFGLGTRAGGGVASGWNLVGENGPELVHSGINSMRVYNARQAGGAGSAGGINYAPRTIFNVQGDVDQRTKAELLSYVEQARRQDQRGMIELLRRNGFGRMR